MHDDDDDDCDDLHDEVHDVVDVDLHDVDQNEGIMTSASSSL